MLLLAGLNLVGIKQRYVSIDIGSLKLMSGLLRIDQL